MRIFVLKTVKFHQNYSLEKQWRMIKVNMNNNLLQRYLQMWWLNMWPKKKIRQRGTTQEGPLHCQYTGNIKWSIVTFLGRISLMVATAIKTVQLDTINPIHVTSWAKANIHRLSFIHTFPYSQFTIKFHEPTPTNIPLWFPKLMFIEGEAPTELLPWDVAH